MSGRPKGYAKTGGRKRGTPNKRTVAQEQASAASAEKIAGILGPAAFDGDAHALLMAVYKDETKPIDLRIQAARAAISYEKPRLSVVDAKAGVGLTLEQLVLASMEDRRP